jgi:hypothetical protein
MKMNKIYFSLYKAFIIASIVTLLIGFATQGAVSLGATLTAYSILALALFMILSILFQNEIEHSGNNGLFALIFALLSSSGPFLLMLGVIGLLMQITISNKSIISSNHVSQSYYSFSNITNVMIFLQLYLLYTELNTPSFIETGKIGRVTTSILYLLVVITSISSLILYTILNYYTTDGFRVNR